MQSKLDRIVNAVVHKVELQVLEDLRQTPCDCAHEQCGGVGLCVVRRPDDVARMRDAGAARVGASPGVGSVRSDLAPLIDHTLLEARASLDDLRKLCDEARRHGFASVCVNGANVRVCKERLHGSGVMVVAVVGFPLGAMEAHAKAYEAQRAIQDGADEVDMVINLGALESRDYGTVERDIRAVVSRAAPRPVKVIIEATALEHDQKVIACSLAKAAGAAFVKTSTGFGPGGATLADVRLMRSVVGADVGVKASGGIGNSRKAEAMVRAGATRIGASASVAIVSGEEGPAGY